MNVAEGTGGFVGLANYANLFGDGDFQAALGHTVLFVVLNVPVLVAAGLILALVLNRDLSGRNMLRAAFVGPYLLPGAAVALIWTLVLDPVDGSLNTVLKAVGLPVQQWLTEPGQAMGAVVLLTLWWRVGFPLLILLAALQDIPKQLYESARIDGASRWQQFRYVTLPGIAPVLGLVVLLQADRLVQGVRAGLPADPGRSERQHSRRTADALRDRIPRLPDRVRRRDRLVARTHHPGGHDRPSGRQPTEREVMSHAAQVRRVTTTVRAQRRRARWLATAAALVFAILWGLPLLWTLSSSFEGSTTPGSRLLPSDPTLANWEMLVDPGGRAVNIFIAFFNSTVVAVVSTVLALLVCSMAGYALAKLPFRGNAAVFGLLLATMLIPGEVVLVPLFQQFRELGLLNTYGALALPHIVSLLGVVLVRQFIVNLPPDLIDAAKADGANAWQIYRYVVVPLIRPALATLGILVFLELERLPRPLDLDQFAEYADPPAGPGHVPIGVRRRRLRRRDGFGRARHHSTTCSSSSLPSDSSSPA